MAYSLLNRFRGTFMGVAIAESQKGILDFGSGDSQIMMESAKSLIRCGGLNLRDWLSHDIATQSACISLETGFLALLPIILFYHEDEYWLEKQLKLAMNQWSAAQFKESDIMVIAWAIAHVLTKKFISETTINDLIKSLENAGKPDNSQGENLAKILRLFAEYASLETAMAELNRNNHSESAAIYLALYCFLSTPEQFQVSIQRAAQTHPKLHLTTLIAAALSGAYNSHAGIPMTRQLIESNQTPPNRHKIQLFTLADRLYATWLGLYSVDKHLEKNLCQRQMMMVTDPHQLVPPV
jgi:hypothetical protein